MPIPDNRKARAGVPGLVGNGSAEVEDWQSRLSELPSIAQGHSRGPASQTAELQGGEANQL